MISISRVTTYPLTDQLMSQRGRVEGKPFCNEFNPFYSSMSFPDQISPFIFIRISILIKRPTRDACLCMGEHLAPPAPPAPHFVFLITL